MKKLALDEINKRMAAVNALPAEEASPEDLAAIAAAEAEAPDEAVTLAEYKQQRMQRESGATHF